MSDAIDARLWEICRDLVAQDTVPDRSNVPAAQWAADLLDRAGWTVHLLRDHALGADKASVVGWAGPAEPGGLLLCGHLDVVPWAQQPGWTRPALELTRDGDRIYGRGVADMKAFVAACLHLAERADLQALSRPIAILLTCDEEPGCLGIARQLDAIGDLLRQVPCPDEAVIGEPTSWKVYGAHRGHVRVTLHVHGRGGHSSRPDLGLNAIDVAADVILGVRRIAQDARALVSSIDETLYPAHAAIPFNVGLVQGGCAINMIPEACDVAFGFRPADDRQLRWVLDHVNAMVRQTEAKWPTSRIDLGTIEITPPLQPSKGGRAAAVLRDLSGQDELLGAPYATDASYLQRLGIDCLLWGPGEIEQAHQADESLPMSSFTALPGRLDTLVRRTCA